MDNRKRILELYRYLSEESDEKHPLTIDVIVKNMSKALKKDIDHKTIRADLKFLLDAGIDLVAYRGKKRYYYIGERLFQTSELRTLIDAVSSAQFITKEKTKILQDKILKSYSKYDREIFSKHIDLINNIKQVNEHIYYGIDAINQAITDKKNISFKYITYDENKNVIYKHDAKVYNVSPYALTWNNDRYYLIAYNLDDKEIRNYRVDRIRFAEELDTEYVMYTNKKCNNLFSMFNGPEIIVKLKCRNSMMDQIIDKFGIDVKTEALEDETFLATVSVQMSPTFYAWIFTFGGAVRIFSPDEAINSYKEFYKSSEI